MSYLFLLISASFCATCLGLDFKQCKEEDVACVSANSQILFDATVKGDPNLGMEPLDPMYHDLIDGDLSIIKYKLKNSTFSGLSKCKVPYAKISIKDSSLDLNIVCPIISVIGIYEADGRLIILPIQGNGDFTLTAKNYNFTVDAEVKTIEKNGKTYLNVKNFKYEANILDGVDFDLANLFNGQKDLAEPVLKFARENWREVAKELQGPILNVNMKILVKSLNKLLKTVPVDQMLLP